VSQEELCITNHCQTTLNNITPVFYSEMFPSREVLLKLYSSRRMSHWDTPTIIDQISACNSFQHGAAVCDECPLPRRNLFMFVSLISSNHRYMCNNDCISTRCTNQTWHAKTNLITQTRNMFSVWGMTKLRSADINDMRLPATIAQSEQLTWWVFNKVILVNCHWY